jgi:membrane protease YdiL (CAAX protease family)
LTSEPQEEDQSEERGLVPEILGMLAVVYILVLGASLLAGSVAFVANSLYVIVAAVFLYIPWWWMDRKGLDFDAFGLTTERMGRDILIGLAAALLTAAPFAAGYWYWQTEVHDRAYQFQWSNYLKWSPEYEGEPDSWGDEPGVWIWTRDRQVHVGVRAEDAQRSTFSVEVDEPMLPIVEGEASAKMDGADRTRWEVRVPAGSGKSRLVVRPQGPGTADFAKTLSVEATSDATLPIRAGPSASRKSDGSFSMHRGLGWLGLWLITHVFFVALPEEFFYRGYLQTRIRQAFGYEVDSTDEADTAGDSAIAGFTASNLLASIAFAAGHLLIPIGGQIQPGRASVFFPSLIFGWLRDWTGGVAASVTYHAACNMMMLLAAVHFF